MNRKNTLSYRGIRCLLLCFLITGCYIEESTCVSCHTDEEKLKEVADPIEHEESEGGG